MGAGRFRRRLVLLSGGLDSAAILYAAFRGETSALFVDYGQVTACGELAAARRLASVRAVHLEVADAPGLGRLGTGALAATATALEADGGTALQRNEWFPARNLALISIAAIVLGRIGGGELWLGASEPSYRDTRPTFFEAAELAARESLPESMPISVVVPDARRVDVLRAAVAEGLEPRLTFSCNRRSDRHCWRCASCRDRAVLLDELRIPLTASEH